MTTVKRILLGISAGALGAASVWIPAYELSAATQASWFYAPWIITGAAGVVGAVVLIVASFV